MILLGKVMTLVLRTLIVFSPLFGAALLGILLKPILGSAAFILLGVLSAPAIITIVSYFQDKDRRTGYQSLL